MSLPSNFAGMPKEDLHHHFRNVCHEFKKKIKASKDVSELSEEFERFIGVAKEIHFNKKNSGVYHKDDGEKAISKISSEFKRYIQEINKHQNATSVDLLNSISEIEQLAK